MFAMTSKRILAILIIALTIGASLLLYTRLPAELAAHWNVVGQADGTMSRTWGVATLPLIMICVLLLFYALPAFDPLQKNMETVKIRVDTFLVAMMLFLAYLQALILIWNLGTHFDMTRWLIPGLALLFFAMGWCMVGLKQNWFFGIRTPWTLQDESVWDETHRLGGRAFEGAAVAMLIDLLLPPTYAIWVILIPLLGAALYSVVLSYILYQKKHPSI